MGKISIGQLTLKAIKLPIVYLLSGIGLLMLSYVDDFIPSQSLKYFFDLSDDVGSLFIGLGILTFLYKLAVLFCLDYEKHLYHQHKIAALILSSLRKSLRIIFILATIHIIITFFDPAKSYLILANKAIHTIIIASLGWVAIQILYTFEAVIYQRMVQATQDPHRAKALYTKTRIIRNIASVAIAAITVAVILMSFDSFKNIGISLLASAGFLTAILGLSAQKTLFSIFSSMQLALAQCVKIGDIVVIEKESGTVEEINFTHITLKLGDRKRLIVPINYFIDKPFENWSHDANSLRSSILLHVDFMMPIEALHNELDRILQQSVFWDGAAKKLQIANLTDKHVEIRIQLSAANADNLSDLRAEVREKILAFMQIHYPQYWPQTRMQQIQEHRYLVKATHQEEGIE